MAWKWRFAPRPADLFGVGLGAFATIAQVGLMREALALAGGNELAIALGFAAWLLGVGTSALAAGTLPPSRGLCGAASFAAAPVTLAALFLLRLHRRVLDAPVGADPSLPALAAVLAVGLGAGGLLVGFLFTTAARSLGEGERAPVSRLYAAEALGALSGGLAFAFALAAGLSHLTGVGLFGALLAASASSFPATAPRRLAAGLTAVAMGLFAAAGPLGYLGDLADRRALALRGGGELVDARDSAYGSLVLSRSGGQHTLWVDGRFDHAFPDPYERSAPVHVALAQHPAPRRVLLVGGGPSDRLEAALAHHPSRVVLTYLDERAHAMCLPFWPASTRAALADPRVAAVHDDGRRFLTRTSERFDVVLISTRPPESAEENRYHTREMFAAAARVLAPGGSLTVLAAGGATLLSPEAARSAASERLTLRSVFPEIAAAPGAVLSFSAAASPGVVTTDPAVLAARFAARRVDDPRFTARRFFSLFDAERVADLERVLAGAPAALNTDARPRVYLDNLELKERGLTRPGETREDTVTGRAAADALVWLAAPFGLWLVWRTARLVRRRRGAGDALFAIATTGAAGMGAEIAILYVFQVASGRLYAGLALLVALFMAGLAAGALLGRRLLASRRARDGLVADGLVLAVLLASIPVLGAALSFAWLAGAWSAVAGLATGAAFPAFLGLAAEARGGDERRAAAALEAAAHLGAAFGALATGVVGLPVLGLTGVCLLFAALKVASLAGQLLAPR